jgi:hypothetical protein
MPSALHGGIGLSTRTNPASLPSFSFATCVHSLQQSVFLLAVRSLVAIGLFEQVTANYHTYTGGRYSDSGPQYLMPWN